MKQQQQLLLLFFLSIFCVNAVSAQCSGLINLYSQATVDDFVANNSCTVIEGDLILGGYDDIQDLSGLQTITTIEGDLSLGSYIEDLSGLQNITTIGGDLTLTDFYESANLEGLENLTSIGGSIEIFESSLRNFKGLENLANIGGGIDLSYVYDSIGFEGLENLTSIGGNIKIEESYDFIGFKGLENLATIGGGLMVSTSQITNFEGLENLQNLEFLSLYENYNLTNFRGLENLQSVGLLRSEYNGNLINFEGLQNLTTIGSLTVKSCGITNFEGLENLTNIEGTNGELFYSFDLIYNNDLINFKGLESLNSIENGFHVQSQDNLVNFEGLEGLAYVSGTCFITSNPSLISLSGLENLNMEDTSSVNISNNPNLEFCCPIINFGILENEGNYALNGNAPSCSSLDVILPNCSETEIQAQAFHDENANGVYDNSEQFLVRNITIEPNAIYAYINQMGVNSFSLLENGNYTLSYDDSSDPLWTIDSVYNNIEIAFQDTLIYFPLTSVTDIESQRIDLSSSITRCNRETNYWLTYLNKGTVTTSGVIELIPDDLPEFISSDPPADSTSNDGKLYWFYNDLYPTHIEKIHLIYEMPGVDDLGEMINFEANMKTNEGYAGHRTLLSSELICAYDPNDKLHTPSGYGNENYTLFGDTLEYTIRFQNTGNDTAFNVEIRDELSELLNLTTFETISSSHEVETQIDIESRIATFKFTDIYLPDSFVNEPASHGFVKYKILGNAGLDENSDIKNTASIYFDENPAIVTNTVNNRMVSELPSLPVVSANPSVLDFGEISINNSSVSEQMLTISNLGDLPLEINAFDFKNPAFNAGELQNLTIEGLSSQEIPIYFKPTTVGDYESELILQSNVGSLTINLSGKATMATGLKTLNQSKVQVYPNPNNGKFTIQSLDENILSYTITNSLGEIILQEKINQDFLELDLSAQSKGLYFISIETVAGIILDKVIVY